MCSNSYNKTVTKLYACANICSDMLALKRHNEAELLRMRNILKKLSPIYVETFEDLSNDLLYKNDLVIEALIDIIETDVITKHVSL